jgi:probable phosphoglycerate mutase
MPRQQRHFGADEGIGALVPGYIVHADGASRGNPGDAAAGAVILDADTGALVAELGTLCGVASNNVTEYRGLIEALRLLRSWQATEPVVVKMDSKLVVEQMSGNWKVKHPDMRELVKTAHAIIQEGLNVHFQWVPREDNSLADAAANRALDGGKDFLDLYRSTGV